MNPALIYGNITKMMAVRGISVTSRRPADDSIIHDLGHHDYVTITGTRANDPLRGSADVVCVLVAAGSEVASAVQRFRAMFAAASTLLANSTSREYIIICDATPNTFITAFLAAQNAVAGQHVELQQMKLFKTDLMQVACIPRHELMTPAEVAEVCEYLYMTPESFPELKADDPVAVWLGARPGMVVRIHRVSENAGIAIAYRTVTA